MNFEQAPDINQGQGVRPEKEISPEKAKEVVERIQDIRASRDEKIKELNDELKKIPQGGSKGDIFKELVDTHRSYEASLEKILKELD